MQTIRLNCDLFGVCIHREVVQQYKPREVLILCGKGNNGGDGYVVARHALLNGLSVKLGQVPVSLSGDAKTAQDSFVTAGGEILEISQLTDPDFFKADVVVDALLGIGLTGSVRTPIADIIALVNRVGKPVVSIDIPSGLSGETGMVQGISIKATDTVTFIGNKRGLLTGAAAEYVGTLYFAGLGVNKAFEGIAPSNVELVTKDHFANLLLPRQRTANKGNFGKVVLIGGDKGMPGALRLAAEACQRTGAGLVRAVTHPESAISVSSGRPELMVSGLDESEYMTGLDVHVTWASVFVLGPGLGQGTWGSTLFRHLVGNITKPMVKCSS